MRTFTSRSENTDARLAVEEASSAVPPGVVPDIVFCFASVKQPPDVVAEALAARFPNSLAVGCTTAGEIVNGQRSSGSLVVSALETPGVRWEAATLNGLNSTAGIEATVAELSQRLGCDLDHHAPGTYFAMLLIDGMSGREESVAAAVAAASPWIRSWAP